jgi:NAD(P)-dependent dehydrogenase (short-subunit alcohol dehydrogenase family)
MARVHDKVAIVTGAARGIGEACARLLAREGATVYVTDIDDALGASVAASIGGAARYEHLDVREEADWRRVIAGVVQRHGRLDVLVNNAGITGFVPPMGPQDPEHASLESWRAVHATNLDGVFLGCKHAIGAMKPGPGRNRSGGAASIVNISSRSGQVGISGAAAYASSKAGVRNHTKSVALYCAEQGYAIRCNSVHPGAILTPMWEPMLGQGAAREEAIRGFAAEVPLGRMGQADEVAAMVLYLASDESAYVTGSEFIIDGGIMAGAAATPKRG